ncbi:MAG TPA: FkbM family methyltransferase [Gemmatimonadaceae bacterium]|nr:FkbM family methyltransferase [Gemmatimonadaceae bacterium]
MTAPVPTLPEPVAFPRAAAAVLAPVTRWVMRHWPRRLPGLGRYRLAAALHRRVAPSAPRVDARTSWGARMRCDLRDLVQSRIYYFGVWEPNLTRLLRRRLRPGDVFVDVGANVGYFSLLASRLVGPNGSVVAIDASPAMYGLLRENVARNDLTNVRTVNAAVSDREGVLAVYAGPPDNRGSTSTRADRGGSFEAEVRAAPLLSLLTPEERARVRLLKIDVEGAELPLLRDLLANLDSFPPAMEFVVELSPAALEEGGMPVGELLRRFAERGYHWYTLENDYDVHQYFDGGARPAERGRTDPTAQVDVVFSREDAAVLD